MWVAGEVQRFRASPRGHLYFELVEKGLRDEIVGKLEGVIWKTDWQRVQRLLAASGQKLADGVTLRCRGGLDFYAPGGRLQLVVREIDPVFTLGLLEQRRQETLQALAAAGLVERNKSLELPDVPLRIALITSHESAAYHDFLSCLRESGYGFRVVFFHASVQGKEAEREVVSALRALAGLPVDCAVLIRGGGSRTDLAAFDSRAIAEAVALAPLPVLTGLGHETDQSIADLVAHTSLKTPTKVAEQLIETVRRREREVADLRRAILREAVEPLHRGQAELGRAAQRVERVLVRLTSLGHRLDEMSRTFGRLGRSTLRRAEEKGTVAQIRIGEAAGRRLERADRDRRHLGERIAGTARGRCREALARLDGTARLAAQLGPEKTLARGFSITRDGAGRVVRHPDQVRPGDRLRTRIAGGELVSRVEEP